MSHLSTSLKSESEKYRRAARQLNISAMIRQWAPVAAVVLVLLVFVWYQFS